MRGVRWSTLLIALGLGIACDSASGPGLTLDVTPDSLQLIRADTTRLSVNALDGAGHLVTGVAVTFESSDTTIATVSNVGLVRSGTVIGRTTIVVSGGGTSTVVPIRVIPTPAGVRITPQDTTIRGAHILQYHAAVVDGSGDTIPDLVLSWHSNDTTVATISATGLATAKPTVGTTLITAQYRVYAAYAVLRVATPGIPVDITVSPADTAIASGHSVQLRATVRDAFGDSVPNVPVTWESLDPPKATVSSAGLVHSQGPPGVVAIRASSGSLSRTAPVTVLDTILSGRTKVRNRAYAAGISLANVAYVSQSDLALILRWNLVSQTVNDSVTVGSIPTEMAFNSTGTRLYVTNQGSGSISVIDVAANAVIDAIPVGNRPFEVIVEPGDSVLWTGKIDSLYGIRLATKEIIARFQIGDVGNGVAIADDTLLYVSTHTTGTVVEINLRTRARGRTFNVGGVPQKLVVSPDGSQLYIANESGYIQFWDLASGTQIGSSLTLPAGAYGLARRASNGLLYATSAYFGGGYIYVIDPGTRTLLHSAVVGGSTRHVVFTADGSIGLVPNENGWVDFIK